MKKTLSPLTFSAALIASVLFSSSVSAQLLSNPLQNAQNAANATQRAQAQIQQRVQVQAQQRLQTQIQQQIQAQTQQQIQAQTQQRIQSQAKLRLPLSGAVRLNASAKAGASVNSNTRMRGAGQQFRTDGSSRTRADLSTGIPVTLSTEEMTDLDVVFGTFNPFRRRANRNPAAETRSKNEVRGSAGVVTAAGFSERADNQDDTDEGSSESRRRPVRLYFENEIDFQASLIAAVRQRRAEISAMRDQAVAEANTRMMAQADRMEGMLDAYVAAEAKASARAGSTVEGTSRRPRPQNAVIQAGAETESRARVRTAPPRRNPQPGDSSPQP